MPKKIFISYSHLQGEWVFGRLVPCLKAGGAEVLIDRERFKAGKAIVGQMDATQDQADVHLLLLSKAYLKSAACTHEMERAVRRDRSFRKGIVVPVRLDDCRLPAIIGKSNPLHVDLRREDTKQWDLLLEGCRAKLGADAPPWLEARDDIARFLRAKKSVNFVVNGTLARPLIDHIAADHLTDLGTVDLEDGKTTTRLGLVTEILAAFGVKSPKPRPGEDLVELSRAIESRPSSRLALTHFDLVPYRPDYDVNLFGAVRDLMRRRKLVLLIQSRAPFATLLPRDNPLSKIQVQTVELTPRA